MTSDFSQVTDRELKIAYKPRKWPVHKMRGDPYYVLEHNVKVLIGPADLKFQLWFKGSRFEDEDQSLALQWVEDTASDRELRQRRLERIRGRLPSATDELREKRREEKRREEKRRERKRSSSATYVV